MLEVPSGGLGKLSLTSEALADYAATYLQLESADVENLVQSSPHTWVFWSLTVLSGGEVAHYPHPEEWTELVSTGLGSLMVGESVVEGRPVLDFTKGRLAKKMEELYASPSPEARERFEIFSKILAVLTMEYDHLARVEGESVDEVLGLKDYPATMLSRKEDAQLAFFPSPAGPHEYELEGPVQSVVTFGPGMTGGSFIRLLADNAREVHLVSGGMASYYVSTFAALKAEWSRHRRPEIRMPRCRYYISGIAKSISELQENSGGEPLDVAVMSRVHVAGPEECKAGVRGSHELLRPGGYLLVNAPQESREGEACLDLVLPQAQELFGDPVAAGDLTYSRPAGYAIFQKQ